jgi:molybdate transport system ATP-binding protein
MRHSSPGSSSEVSKDALDAFIRARFVLAYPSNRRDAFTLDVNLELPSGGITGVFGPSGSGKTTLLRCIAGLEQVSDGFFSFRNEIWQQNKFRLPAHKRPLGYVFQDANLFPHLTVLGNLRYAMKRARTKHQPDRIVTLLDIEHLLERKPERLSGGERQRVAIARALLVDPKLLLMDEPLSSLDAVRKREILPYLERLRDELQIPVLYVSHSPDEIARLADHLVVLENGRVSAAGEVNEVLTRLDPPLRLGEETGVVLPATVGAVDADWHLMRLDFAGGSLWTRQVEILVGHRVRIRVLARDVSLSLQQPDLSSIQNLLRGTVDAVADDEHPGLALARVNVGASSLLARLTKRASAALGLSPGTNVWVQVKSAALMGPG